MKENRVYLKVNHSYISVTYSEDFVKKFIDEVKYCIIKKQPRPLKKGIVAELKILPCKSNKSQALSPLKKHGTMLLYQSGIFDLFYHFPGNRLKGYIFVHKDLISKKNIDILPDYLRNVFKIAIACILYRTNAILVHGAGILINGSTHLFLGPSGSGKSTISRLLNKYKILDDENIIVKRKGRQFYAQEIKGNKSYKIKNIFVLHKSEKNKILEISRHEFLKYTSTDFTKFMRYSNTKDKAFIFNFFTDLFESVPCRKLCFKKDKRSLTKIILANT